MSNDVRRPSPTESAPLLLDVKQLAQLLDRSVASLYRDKAAGRLPDPVQIGRSKRWRRADISAWVEMGCPTKKEFEARMAAGRPRR